MIKIMAHWYCYLMIESSSRALVKRVKQNCEIYRYIMRNNKKSPSVNERGFFKKT